MEATTRTKTNPTTAGLIWLVKKWSARREAPPILVTSLPRSGSTWVMKMLSASHEVFDFHEPDYLHLWGLGEPGMHPYIAPEREDSRYENMYHYIFAGLSFRPPQFTKSFLRQDFKFFNATLKRKRVLVKSVYSFANTEWIARRFPVKVVVLLRHPCAVVHSIHRRWPDARLKDLTLQPEAMRNGLEPYREVLESARTPYEILASRIGAYYAIMARAAERNPDWHIVRHEDLCVDPVGGFRRLYADLGLKRFELAMPAIEGANRPKGSDEVQHVQRVASEEIDKWRTLLSPGEIDSIAEYFCPFPSPWYADPRTAAQPPIKADRYAGIELRS